jgi:catechol 2,3-dioxygenase-like lactoylglutathione lyase family enzyme
VSALGARTFIHSGRRGRSATGSERSIGLSVFAAWDHPFVDHLAIPVTDQARSQRFYETYFGFGASPARPMDDDVLMLYDADGFSLALGSADGPIDVPEFLHFGVHAPSPQAVWELRDRLVAEGVEIVGEWDESNYVSIKCLDPDGYTVEYGCDPTRL